MSHSPAHPLLASAVADRAAADLDRTLDQLCGYLRVPAISCQAENAEDVHRLARMVRDDLEALGLDRARVLELPDALPCVAAEWLHAGPAAPTVLVYGHLDLQPVKGEPWTSPPHEPTVRGGRLYARGAADDMGGWVSHLAALRAWFEEAHGLPCNIKLLVEGEEEIGSPNLEAYMDAFPDAFEADVMVLTDCENPSTEEPGLTVSLRGLLELELTVRALEADVHSGLWGNMAPDVGIALCRLVARLTDEDGRLVVGRQAVDPYWAQRSWDLPLDEEVIAQGAHLVEGVSPLPHRGRSPAEWIWRQPALSVVATTLPDLAHKKNALRSEARAILSIRLAPGQEIADMIEAVREVVCTDPPGGVAVSLEQKGWAGEGWLYSPTGAAFEAADAAYRTAWGSSLVQVGVGGSIPFVALFARRYGSLPLILNGVMDPLSTAHGPNESLHLGVFAKAVAANVHLYAELGALGRSGVSGR